MNRKDPIDPLERSPLALVIGQVRFSPVRKMPELVDDLQDVMRHSGLERFNEEKVQQVHFGPKITTTDVTRWVFSNRDRTESVFLTAELCCPGNQQLLQVRGFQRASNGFNRQDPGDRGSLVR